MEFNISLITGNVPKQDTKQQIDETERIRCELENTVFLENYKIQQQERLRELEVSSRAQANWDKTTITISSSAIALIWYLLKGENIVFSATPFLLSLTLWSGVVPCVMLSFLAGARLHRKCADSIAHQLNEENEQAASSEAKAKKMDTVIKYCNFIGSVLFLLALASTVYLSFKTISNSHDRTPHQQQTDGKIE